MTSQTKANTRNIVRQERKGEKGRKRERDLPSCSVSVVGEKVGGERAVAGLVTSPGGHPLVMQYSI